MREPGGILGEIVARKRRDVATRFAFSGDPRERARPTGLSLAEALARPGSRFVMEVKRSSPSEGALKADVDPAALARAYSGAADAISVLTDGPYFGGSLADLAAVRKVFDGPILAKDFVVDLRQIAEARLSGADAVLVMLSVLEDAEAAGMIAEAARLGMEALVEAHDEEEVRRAVALDARLIGINNRDLKTLKVDLAVTERLAHLVPADRVLVAESGIAGRADVERLAAHADAFLVGSSLMKAERPAEAARVLAFGRVKVCGLTSPEDARLAAQAGAAYAGLVMVPGTPRAVSGEAAEAVASAAREAGIAPVGVFRDEKPLQVAMTAQTLGLAAVQLHGEEDAGYIKALRNLLPEACEIWAAGAVGEDVPAPRPGADRTLFDTKVAGRSGGTGRSFNWSRLQGREELSTALLAGGLNPDNARVAAGVGAYALDIGSGVEAAPGRKDPAKLGAFFQALRAPTRRETQSC
jgi:indole-3-glycerol phosphate synthase/phosphoribosylanthranilate isomerase